MASHNNTRTFKVALIGDGCVGKTTFVKRHRTGEFEQKYVPTLGVEVHPLRFQTTHGEYVLNIWDCAGQEKFGGLRDGYYIQSKAFIIMFDVGNKTSYKNLMRWYRDARRMSYKDGDDNIVIVGNKVDVEDRKVKAEDITFHRDAANDNGMRDGVIAYCDCSVKSNYNFEKPILALLRSLTGIHDLELVDNTPITC